MQVSIILGIGSQQFFFFSLLTHPISYHKIHTSGRVLSDMRCKIGQIIGVTNVTLPRNETNWSDHSTNCFIGI